jgi:hypothetical protein
MWQWLPAGGTEHDAYAYLKEEDEKQQQEVKVIQPLQVAAV